MDININIQNRQNIDAYKKEDTITKININTNDKAQTNTQSTQNIKNIDTLELMLKEMGQSLSKENEDIIKFLMKNFMPINKENISTIKKGEKLFSGDILEKALFFIKNDMKITKDTVAQLEGYISKDISLNKQLDTLIKDILNTDNPDEILSSIFKNTKELNLAMQTKGGILNLQKDIVKSLLNNSNINKAMNTLDANTKNEVLKTIQNLVKNIIPNDIMTNKKAMQTLQNIMKNTPNNTQNESKIVKNTFDSIKNILVKNGVNKNILNTMNKDFIKDMLQDVFKNKEHTKTLENANKIGDIIKQKLSFNPDKSSPKELNTFLNEIKELTGEIASKIQKDTGTTGENTGLSKSAGDIGKNIDFMNAMKDSTYLQIPININQTQTNAELFVFKDNKKMKKDEKNSSALISLDLEHIGKVETYINKIRKDIYCQIRLEKDETKILMQKNSTLLKMYLKEKGFSLKEISFKDLEDSFTIISNEKENKKTNKNINIARFSAEV